MITKKELALVASAVLACGQASGFSIKQILDFAKQQRPHPAWLTALEAAAKGKKND
jgi:hypothetical protein